MSTQTQTPEPSQPQHSTPPAHDAHAVTTLAIQTGRIACEECAAIVERRLRTSPYVLGVHVDAEHQVAHVQVDEGMVTAEELAELVADAYGERAPVPLPKPEVSSHAHAHTARPAAET